MNKLVAIIFIFVIGFSNFSVIASNNQKSNFEDEVEYWGLIIGVEYGITIDEDSDMVGNALDLQKTLLNSEHWKEENIKLIIGTNATKINIIKGLNWLRKVSDKNDYVLIYFSGHGGQLLRNIPKIGKNITLDIPPFDEKDRCDEFLTTFWTSEKLFANIRDDLFTMLVYSIRSKNLCVIIDSCYSGGIVDTNIGKFFGTKNIIVLTSSDESQAAGGSFSNCLIKGIQGFADYDHDGICTAEESFMYAYTEPSELGNPTITDFFPKEFPISIANIPPETPTLKLMSSNIIKIGEKCNFSSLSFDQDNDNITYGFDWDYNEFWSEGTHEWTENYESGETCNISHIWEEPGIYNIRVRAKDEKGAERLYFQGQWSNIVKIIVCSENESVDQTVINGYNLDINSRQETKAQSFKPNSTNLSKIKLNLGFIPNGNLYPLTMTIRDNLTGSDFVTVSKIIKTENLTNNYDKPLTKWIEFKFNETLEVTQNSTYYIILNLSSNIDWYHNSNLYENGESFVYISRETNPHWITTFWDDYCFVSYK